jgi:hypothetical protein
LRQAGYYERNAALHHTPEEVDNVKLAKEKQISKAKKKHDALLMTHKYRGCIVVLSINKSVEPNKEQKVLTSGFDQGFTVNTSKRVFRGIW